MNKQRRKDLQGAIDNLNKAYDLILEAQSTVENARDEEEEYRDNMPENLQDSDKYYTADEAVSTLSDVAYSLEELADNVDGEVTNLTENIEEAMG